MGSARGAAAAAAPPRAWREKLRALLAAEHGLFCYTVGAGAMASGSVGFVLYFITQVRRDSEWRAAYS